MLPLRRLAALSLLALLGGCGGASLPSGIPPDPENEKLVGALTAFVDTLGRGEYAAAAGLMCTEEEEPKTEADLKTEFEPHPRPWKQFVTATSRSDRTGDANLDLTPAGKPVVKYTFNLVKLADGSWQVCDLQRGSFHVDVG